MPIMAVADQNDARGTTQFLARTARKCIDGLLEPTTHRVALNNIFRLLHAYRSHEFAGYRYEHRTHRGPEALTLMPSGDRRMDLVARALEEAIQDASGGMERDRVFATLDDVIRKVAMQGVQAVDVDERQVASRFLESFADHLRPSA